MRQYTAARFVIATATFCAVAEKTSDAATAQWEKLLAGDHVTADGIDTTPRLALVDDATSPTAWAIVTEYYRVRHVAKDGDTAFDDAARYHVDDAARYHVGDDANFFEEKAAAIEAARALDDLGDEWDMEVVAFDDVTGSGRVVWLA